MASVRPAGSLTDLDEFVATPLVVDIKPLLLSPELKTYTAVKPKELSEDTVKKCSTLGRKIVKRAKISVKLNLLTQQYDELSKEIDSILDEVK